MPNDWIEQKVLIAKRRVYYWKTIAVNHSDQDTRLKIFRQTAGTVPAKSADAIALSELAAETRMDIALSRAQQLVKLPVELQKVAVDE